MKKLNLKVNLDAKKLKEKMGLKDGVDGKNGKDGISPIIETESIVIEASTRAVDEIKSLIPTIEQLEQKIPVLGEPIRDSLELLEGEDRLDAKAIKGLEKFIKEGKTVEYNKALGLYQLVDVNVSGLTTGQVLKWNGSQWIAANDNDVQNLQQVTDIGATTTHEIIGVDPTTDPALATKKYVDTRTSGGVKSWFFTKTASDIAGMYVATTALPTGSIQTITGTAVKNTETVIAEFLTPLATPEYRVTDGTRFFYVTGRTDNDHLDVTLRGYIYLTDINGANPTLLRTSNISDPLIDTDIQVTMSVYGGSLLIPTTTRVKFVITAINSHNADHDVTISMEDDTFTRLDVPSPVGVTDISGLFKLDQSTPQTVTGQPNFSGGALLGDNGTETIVYQDGSMYVGGTTALSSAYGFTTTVGGTFGNISSDGNEFESDGNGNVHALSLKVVDSLGVQDSSTSYYTYFIGGSQASDITYTLPTALPVSNKVLQSDSSGVLSWVTATGSQTPWTGNIDGATYNLTGVGNLEAVTINATTGITSPYLKTSNTETNYLAKTNTVAWTASGSCSYANNTADTTDPLGTNTAQKFTFSASTAILYKANTGLTAGLSYTLRFWIKLGTCTNMLVNVLTNNSFNSTGGLPLTTEINSSTWTQISYTWTQVGTGAYVEFGGMNASNQELALTTYTQSTGTAYVWGVEIVVNTPTVNPLKIQEQNGVVVFGGNSGVSKVTVMSGQLQLPRILTRSAVSSGIKPSLTFKDWTDTGIFANEVLTTASTLTRAVSVTAGGIYLFDMYVDDSASTLLAKYTRTINVKVRNETDGVIYNALQSTDNWTGTWADSAGTNYFRTGRANGNTAFSAFNGTAYNRLSFIVDDVDAGKGIVFTDYTTALTVPRGYFEIRQISDTRSDFYIGYDGKAGFGTYTPSAKVHSLSTTEQLRLGYDASKYTSFTVDSAGSLTTTPILYNKQDKLVYGSMYGDDVTLTVTVSASSTYYAVPTGLTTGSVNGMTFSASTLTALVAGKYKVDWSMTLSCAVANQETSGAIMINTTAQMQTEGSAKLTTANDNKNVSGSGIITLSVNDVVKLCVENETGTNNIVVTHACMSIIRIDA